MTSNEQDLQYRNVKILVAISSLILSTVGAVLLLATNFGGWIGGTPLTSYFLSLSSFVAPLWMKIFLVIIAIGFIVCAAFAIIWLLAQLELIKGEKLPSKMNIGALISTGIVLIFSLIVAIGFALTYTNFYWWYDISFYWATMGSFMVIIFIVLYMILTKAECPPEKTANAEEEFEESYESAEF
jgi:magnesium-transporting ATPase (P-type)